MEFAEAEPPESIDPATRWFIPRHKLKNRLIVCGVLLVLLAISPGALSAKAIGLATILFLTGSYRNSYIQDEVLYVELTICFYPVKRKKYKLKKFVQIEIMLEEPAGWWTFFLLGPIQWLWSRVLDYVIPWLGGIYQLWLSNGKKKVLVWQGCYDQDYERNLRELQNATGLEAIRTGGY